MAGTAEDGPPMTTDPILRQAWEICRTRMPFRPGLAFVLGSGLADLLGCLQVEETIAFGEFPGFPTPTTADHPGRLVFARCQGLPLLVLQGRLHVYEGFTPAQVVLPIRLLKLLGVGSLVLTNSAGGIRRDLVPGGFMLLSDHLSFLLPSPLRGPNDDALGPRFPDMTRPYDDGLNNLLRQSARDCGIPLPSGVYIQTPGPQFETPAEIRCYRLLGADAVGMSTVGEVVAARHCGIRTACIACIGNKAAGLGDRPLALEEVVEASRKAIPRLSRLLLRFIDLYRNQPQG